MSDPPRLSATHSGLTAAMLDSARDDQPPPSARQRALVAFGAGTGAILTATMAEGGAGLAASGASVATGAKVATWIAIAKWAGGGAVVAVCTAAAVANVSPRAPTVRIEPTAVVSPVPGPVTETTAPATAPFATVDSVPAVVATSPDLVTGPALRGPQPSPSRATRAAPPTMGADTAIEPPARAPDASLAEEVGWLDRASASIRSGDAERGLQVLDEYKGRFPAGVLTPESQVLRIEALVRKGNRVDATRLGESFLARTPQSALAARVRSLLLSMQKEQAP
jgi:hypothetical protein